MSKVTEVLEGVVMTLLAVSMLIFVSVIGASLYVAITDCTPEARE